MPEQNKGLSQTYTNNESTDDIEQYRVAIIDTSAEGGVKLPSGASSVEKIAGIAMAETAAGETADFMFTGIAYVEAHAAFSIGDTLVIGADTGRVMVKPAGATTQGIAIVGVALRAASAQGDVVPVLLQISNEFSS